jgi:uncharacterized protein (DUF58 family)
MTKRGRVVLALGAATFVVARALGSKPLYPVAIGLVLAVAAGWLVVRLARRPLALRREVRPAEPVEGDGVRVETTVAELDRGVGPAPSLVLEEELVRVGSRTTPVRDGRAVYTLPALGRGRYAFTRTTVSIEDPFGLVRAETRLAAATAFLVYPRLVGLERLFSESGGLTHDGRRLLLRRPTGFDLHSVREYERGESLRKVHWRSTAKRGELMVKELEDAPRDEVAVLLDTQVPVIGESFDVQVRAAGSILRAHVRRGRRAVLLVNDASRRMQRVHGGTGDWRQALDLLAAVEPGGTVPAAALVADDAGAAARTFDLTVVTAALTPALVDRLLQRAQSQRRAALVYVDCASFGDTRGARREPALLRLHAGGVPVAVLRRGDDLAERLAGAQPARVVHG